MSDIVISVENIAKSYQLGSVGTGTFYGDLNRMWAKLRGKPDPYLKIGEADHGNRDGETVWALNDINFQIRQGEAVGIIGRNGAGKSTLLKILSRVTAPTSGQIKVKGRVASLLEVGTGFHPELTGRENIFMNGAILGMNRHEISRKFDEIVAFSGVEKYIDTPVKRYSSGMYVRLAFAVAAHLDTDILVVDEVLAVGDAEFQKKCLGKMGDVAHEGRTVLFVSHNMAAIQKLCTQGILLDKGQIVEQGNIHQVIDAYIASRQAGFENGQSLSALPRPVKSFGEKVRFTRARILGKDGALRETNTVMFGEAFSILLEVESSQSVDEISALVGVESMLELRIATLASESMGVFFEVDSGQSLQIQVHVDDLFLRPGHYLLTFAMRRNGKPLDQLPYVMRFEVTQVSAREILQETDLYGFVHASGRWNLYQPEFNLEEL